MRCDGLERAHVLYVCAYEYMYAYVYVYASMYMYLRARSRLANMRNVETLKLIAALEKKKYELEK